MDAFQSSQVTWYKKELKFIMKVSRQCTKRLENATDSGVLVWEGISRESGLLYVFEALGCYLQVGA